ncbi:MAG: protein kinase [Acidobacteria bacterium]|nr:protein kinase [Acidobacteriota bacterium]
MSAVFGYATMIEAGKVLQNRYKVVRQVGQGGMGAVYIATDERFGSTVAIKETLFTDDKFRKAFEREAKLLNSLRHPALPRVSDHFIEGNGQFIVMEYIAGEDLSEQIENDGRAFPVGDVLNWADQLLDALDYLHSQVMPVVHRDIKPQNLKLTPEGQVVLLDFGLAKGNTTNPESATAAKSVFGYSRNYASLEQIQGTGTDPRSDLYSLAATLYHLLAGSPPVDALTRAMNVLSDKPDPSMAIAGVRPDVPVGVSEVLERAMSLNANERPATAREMKSMLEAAARGESFAAAPTIVEGAPQTNLFTQNTQLQSDVETGRKQSEIHTVALSGGESKVTEMRSDVRSDDLAAGKPKRHGLAIGAALGGLVLLGGAAGAAYVFGPSTGNVNTASNANVERKTAAANDSNENTNVALTNANVANQTTAESNSLPANQAKAETVKDGPKPVVSKTQDATKSDARVDAQTVPTPPNARPDPAVTDRPPPPGEVGPARDPRTNQTIPPDVWRKMTTAQRKKLRRALELQREQQNRPDPPQD